MAYRSFICGCASCGCICAEHSPTRREELCTEHGFYVVLRCVLEEAVGLAVLVLFLGNLVLWAGIVREIFSES